MTAAYRCWLCQRQLGRNAAHFALETATTPELICERCTRSRARGVTTRLGNRAQAANVLGLSGTENGGAS